MPKGINEEPNKATFSSPLMFTRLQTLPPHVQKLLNSNPAHQMDLLNGVFSECRRHWSLFAQQQQHHLTTFTQQMSLLKSTQSGANLYQEYISKPLYQHFSTHAPHYIQALKAEPRDDDGWRMWALKRAYNLGVDITTQYAPYALEPLKNFAYDVLTRMPGKTFEALNPGRLFYLSMHHQDVQRYFSQRFDQLTTPIRYYQDPKKAFQQTMIGTSGAFQNLTGHLWQLEGGALGKTKQLGHVIIDMTEEKGAEKLGVWMALFSLYNFVPKVRQNTNTTFDRLFPRGTVTGFYARMLPVKLLFTKPIARVVGNPLLSLTVITYLISMSIAGSLQASHELSQKHPEIHQRLTTYHRDLTNASFHLSVRESIKRIQGK